jgi:hypothetical protein
MHVVAVGGRNEVVLAQARLNDACGIKQADERGKLASVDGHRRGMTGESRPMLHALFPSFGGTGSLAGKLHCCIVSSAARCKDCSIQQL